MKIKYHIILITIFCVLIQSKAWSSFEDKGHGVSQIGLSLSGAASLNPEFALFINPALLSVKNGNSIELFYRNFFGIEGLNQVAFNGTFSLYNFPISAGISRYGNSVYSETEVVLGFSYELEKNIFLGASTSFYFLDIKNYGNDWTVGFKLSAIYQISDQFRIGAVMSNINEPEIGKAGESLPVSGTLALSFSPVEDVELLMDAYKEDINDFEFRFAARVNIFKQINILSGFRDVTNSFSFGLEYRSSSFSVNYAIDVHPVLNASHAFGSSYAF